MINLHPTRFLALATCVVAWVLLMQPNVAMACPTCKNSLHDGTALAYAISILFMMGMPFVILTFWVVTICRLRAKAAEIALATAENRGS